MDISNPHDKFFKEVFSQKENAINFIKEFLPTDLVLHLDLSTLEIDNISYIDEELKEHFSDIVYNCIYQGGTNVKITLLFEHKSYVINYPHLQLLKYMLKIWEAEIKQKEDLTVVIPIIFYPGREKWVAKSVKNYFKGTDKILKVYIPDFQYLLTDLSNYTDSELKTHGVAIAISCLLMKNIFNEVELVERLKDFLEIGRLYFEEEIGLKFLESVIRYICGSADVEIEKIVEVVEQISLKGSDIIMTTAEKLREEGRREVMITSEKLRIEGKMEGKMETAKKMIEEGLSIETIIKCTELSKEDIEKIANRQ